MARRQTQEAKYEYACDFCKEFKPELGFLKFTIIVNNTHTGEAHSKDLCGDCIHDKNIGLRFLMS